MEGRSDALAQLLESALAEQLASPVLGLLAALPLPLAVVHVPDLRIVVANPAFQEVTGRPADEAAGTPIDQLFHPGHPMANPVPYRQAIRRVEAIDRDVIFSGKPFNWFIRPLMDEPGRLEFLLIGLSASPDPTSAADLQRLREANQAKSEFLNMAAHELRTPLGVIHGYGSMLSQGGLSPEHQQLAGLRVYQKARQLSRLISGMMLVARLDELGPQMPRSRLDMVGLVEVETREVQRRFPDLAIELSLEVSSAPVMGNEEWLRIAVRELLDNAARFRPGPGGRVDINLRGGFLLYVMDDGFGIEPEEQAGLFRRFSRIETEHNRHLVGLGIGLYLVREVAEAHRGSVAMKSRPGMGTEFVLSLPPS